MFKKIPGNNQYMADLCGNIKGVNGEECALPVIDDKVLISLYGVSRYFRKTWLGLIAHYELKLLKEHEQYIDRIIFNEVNDSLIPEGSINKIMSFISPLEIIKNNIVFRIIPGYTNYAISKNGDIYSINSRKILLHSDRNVSDGEYITVSIYDPNISKHRKTKLHRLIALAWVPNNKYGECFLINHKDGNKSNNYYKNLEWVSYTDNINHAFLTGLRTDNIKTKIKNIYTGEIIKFYSIKQMMRFLGYKDDKPISSILNKCRKQLILNKYEVKLENDDSDWVFDNDASTKVIGRYQIKSTKNNVTKKYFNIYDLLKDNNLLKYFGKSISKLKNLLAKEKIYLEVIDNYNLNTLDILEVNTGKLRTVSTIREAALLTGVCFGKIKCSVRQNGKYIYNGYSFRNHSNLPWCDFSAYICSPKRILATNTKTNERVEFDSLRKSSLFFNIDRLTIKRKISSGSLLNDWKLSYINVA